VRAATDSGVLSQPAATTASLASVGAKAATLARLAAQGIPVPDFSVVSSAAFARHLEESRIPWPAGGVTDARQWTIVRERIHDSSVGTALSGQILAGYERLCQISGHDRVAARSSGSEEDSQLASFAGQFDTILNVDGSTVVASVKECWASYFSERSLEYREANCIPFGLSPTFGVIIQAQVFSQRAGVMFTVHPLDASQPVLYLEANYGTGESVVGGLATPDSVTAPRSGHGVVEIVTGTKRRMTTLSLDSRGSQIVDVEESMRRSPVLTERDVRELSQMGLHIEQLMKGPQDIEWAYDSHQLWILQARPITGLGKTSV